MRGCRSALFHVLAVIAVIGLYGPAEAKSRWGKSYLPNVELLTQDGKPVRFYDDVIRGKRVVISFIYTSCLDICPLITARMAQLYEQLGPAAGQDVFFVSISIDPVNDTPARLKEHAEAFRSDPRWLFLTGKPADINIVRYKLGERSRKLTEHGGMLMLYDDHTGEWSRDSAFGDIGALLATIRSMDPNWCADPAGKVSASSGSGDTQPTLPAWTDLPGQALFAKACASCHTIGSGDRVGPDLKAVMERRDSGWLRAFIRNPSAMRAQNDGLALSLAAAYPKVRMPNLQLSDSDVTDVLSYLSARTFAVRERDGTATSARGHAAHQHHDQGSHHGTPSTRAHHHH